MKTVLVSFGILATLSFSCSSAHEKKLEYYKAKYTKVSSTDWGKIFLKNSLIENNVWGKEFLRNNCQIIFSNNSGNEFGWYWEYAYTTKRISASPEIITGKNPWFKSSTTASLPVQITSIDSLYCSFGYTSDATGNFENSLGLWITNKKNSMSEDIVLQMVCVFGAVGTDKLGKYQGTVEISNTKMDEYFFSSQDLNFNMVLFYMNTHDLNLQFNLKNYLNYLVIHNYIKKTDYVTSVELATSPKWGKGETIIKEFNCVICSK